MIEGNLPRPPIPSGSKNRRSARSPDIGTEEFRQIELVLGGYTITTKAAALGRVEDRYVMRNSTGHRIELPLLVNVASFVQTWTSFRRSSEAGLQFQMARRQIASFPPAID